MATLAAYRRHAEQYKTPGTADAVFETAMRDRDLGADLGARIDQLAMLAKRLKVLDPKWRPPFTRAERSALLTQLAAEEPRTLAAVFGVSARTIERLRAAESDKNGQDDEPPVPPENVAQKAREHWASEARSTRSSPNGLVRRQVAVVLGSELPKQLTVYDVLEEVSA